jgi:hypothetical protein
MRKRFELAVLGGLAIAFGIGSRFVPQFPVNLLFSVIYSYPQDQILAKSNLPRVLPLPLEEILVRNKGIDSNLSIHFEGNLYAQTPIQEISGKADKERFQRVMQDAITQKMYQRPMGEIVQAIAKQFLGTPYQEDLLDKDKEETLVITLNKFDCVLFVETVSAMARGVAVQDYSYETFVARIRQQRYWNGQMNGYGSRLHYFSEWILDNQKRGAVKNIGHELGGIPLHKKLNFMSQNRQSYPRLVRNDEAYRRIVEMEDKLDGVAVDYIPTNQIHRAYAQLQPGDIVAVATNIPGLDVSHTGLVYRYPDGNIGFIHASPIGQVTIARDLETYVGKVRNAIGILVTRPIDPRQKTNQDTTPYHL